LLSVVIKPEVCDPSDTETLGDLVVAAVRDANHKVAVLAQATMPAMPDMPDLPGLGG
ncbi:MAG TPA: YbaB/EbfC family nucleoid-associated protein, partial [Propionibacteriaceae bacterium]|nr:YbaB/EbfC family nucleoid-associated protein [Propionibacteriaceae bacterium]